MKYFIVETQDVIRPNVILMFASITWVTYN